MVVARCCTCRRAVEPADFVAPIWLYTQDDRICSVVITAAPMAQVLLCSTITMAPSIITAEPTALRKMFLGFTGGCPGLGG